MLIDFAEVRRLAPPIRGIPGASMKILAITAYEKWDPLATTILEGLKKCGAELYCTYPGNGATNLISDEEFIAHYPTAGYILAFFSKMETPPPKYYLIDAVNGWNKTAYLDGSEWNYTGYRFRTDEQLHPLFKERARWYFRRECTPEQQAQGIIPFLFAAVDADFGYYSCEKDVDVLLRFGQLDTGLRAVAAQAVYELGQEGYNVLSIRGCPFSKYLEMINRSWISIEAHGGGEFNVGVWHIMANMSAMFAQDYNIVTPHLQKGLHYIGWGNAEELKTYIRSGLANKDALSELINESYHNLQRFHTSEARARELLALLQS